MPTPRVLLGAAAANNGKLYAVGGGDSSGAATGTVYKYDPASDSWASRADMPTARHGFGAAAGISGRLYAIGGFDGSGSCSSLGACAANEEYDPATNGWASRASMPTARYALGVAAATNGKIYAVGGYSSGAL